MNVLIVSPQVDIAQQLRASLTSFGSEWNLQHVSEPAKAQAMMQDKEPEVLMVEIGSNVQGLQLLRRARENQPGTTRFMILPEDSEPQGYALELAHRHLNLPLDANAFIQAVGSMEKLRAMLNDPILKDRIGKIDKLPTPPELYFAITKALSDPSASMDEIARLITGDPLLAAKVLRVSNSAYFARGRPIADLRSAVTRLGLQVVRRVVLAAEVFPDASSNKQKEIQQRALRASMLATRMLNGATADLAATAALLAEIGRLLPGFSEEAEPAQGPGYAEAGAWLLGLWGLPMPIVEGVIFHRDPSRSQQHGLWIPGAVHIAQAISGSFELNHDYVESVGLTHRIDEWRAWAAKQE